MDSDNNWANYKSYDEYHKANNKNTTNIDKYEKINHGGNNERKIKEELPQSFRDSNDVNEEILGEMEVKFMKRVESAYNKATNNFWISLCIILIILIFIRISWGF